MGSKNKKRTKKGDKSTETAEGGGNRSHEDKLITDPRFASVHSDPRFQAAPRHKSKVAIDSRFNRMFTDKSFASSSVRIDKRGKRREDSSQHPLKHYYRLESVDERKTGKEKSDDAENDKESGSESESEGKSESDSEKMKKLGRDSSDSEASKFDLNDEEEDDNDGDRVSDDSTSSTDSDEDQGIYSEEEEAVVHEENIPEIDKETRRLAVVNLDWNQVKQGMWSGPHCIHVLKFRSSLTYDGLVVDLWNFDLYVLLSSFLPKGGQVHRVAVYPSEFGLKRMEEEAIHGPVGLYDDGKEKKENDDDDDNDDDDEIDNEKLRAYELSRLRYYYAVVECDSCATADYLYKICDGLELERSSNKLDLRFIPDSMEFKHAPRDVATEAPTSYEGVDFHTRALQHSNIQLTWDEDEPQRSRSLKRKFNADQLAELELEEFMASDESGTDEEEDDNDAMDEKRHKKQDMYRALIQSGDGSAGEEDDEGQDMEVTFNTGLEDISKRILEKKDRKSETVWEAYNRKRKEKKKARKNRAKDSSEDESSDIDQEPAEQPDDFFIEESPPKGSKEGRGNSTRKGKQQQEAAKDDAASRAELELLLADDKGAETNLKGYNLKLKKSRGKVAKETSEEGKLPTADYDDPRFSSIFTSPLFALDPTDPQFKRSAAYARQIAKKQPEDEQEMARQERRALPGQPQLSDDLEKHKNESDQLPSKKEKHELASLVKSIKMKSNQVPIPSVGKMSRKKGKHSF
ncbi:hypothetical protein RJ639_031030 [Escallonia herrerae]|uniref:NUC153 domain-containing protein n=1 Tax=Escallonia herrerae TaxID=1293975 RepID=A0AA88WZH1_9ASTE|nr:hypothetical protein RJ639_031030 [Escallonia herrerae]